MTSNAEHWRQVHLRGDKNPPIYLTDRRVRRSVGTATVWRSKGREAQCYE